MTGDYKFRIKTSFCDLTVPDTDFNLKVIFKTSNKDNENAPYFEDELLTQTVEVNETLVYRLPQITDFEGDKVEVTVTL